MTRLISILMLSTMLLLQTPVHQVFKFGTLIEHYQEHKALNERMSFWSFLEIHYAHNDEKQGDYDRDMQLPFKQCSHISFVFTYFEQTVFTWKQETFFPDIIKPLSAYSTPFHTAVALSNIWQPPRC